MRLSRARARFCALGSPGRKSIAIEVSAPTQPSPDREHGAQEFGRIQEQRRHDQKIRRLSYTLRVAFGFYLLYSIDFLIRGDWGNMAVQVVACLISGAGYWCLRCEDEHKRAAWSLLHSLMVSIAGAALLSGASKSTSIWLVALPVMAGASFLSSEEIKRFARYPIPLALGIYGAGHCFPLLTDYEFAPFQRFATHILNALVLIYLSYLQHRQDESEVKAMAFQRELYVQETKRAEVESSNKSRFLAKMSHELRTPMNGFLGMVQHLRGQALEKQEGPLLDRLEQRAEQILEEINDALELTQIDAGAELRRQSCFDLENLVQRVCRLQTPSDRKMDARIETQIELQSSHFVGDARRIRQLISTILGTAIHLGSGEKIFLRVLGETGARGQVDTTIEVKFREAEPESAGKAELFDLLGPAFRMANLLDGSFRVIREGPRKLGCLAQLTLKTASAEQIPAAPTQKVAKPAASSSHRARVLVVDDNAINRKVAGLLLERLGCEVQSAVDGIEAVEMAKTGNYDAIFMDLRMPRMDGFEATRRILAFDEGRPSSNTIIALTANAYQEDIEQSLACGMVAHLAKPVSLQKLQLVLDEHLQVPELQQAA